MTVAAFLPSDAANHLASVTGGELLRVHSWRELENQLSEKGATVVVLDPAADGSMNVSAVVSLRKKFPELPVIAYVPLSPQSLNAAGTLSRHNVTQFLLHPQDGVVRRFRCALERAAADTVTSQFLGCLEAALGRFPFRLMLSVQDLFDRPGRYETALDFAYQCGVPLKTVYRWFEDGRIGTPKKLIVAAKVLRAYCYLRNHRCSTVLVSRNVGYGSPRRLTKHVYSIFGCSPRWLATQSSTTELFMGLFDWMYKPSGLSKRCARTTPVNCRRVLG